MIINKELMMKKLLLLFVILMIGAAPSTGNTELDKGLKEANDYLENPVKGTLWRTTIQNELFWLTDLTLGDVKFTKVTVNTIDKKLENMFVSTGTYEVIDAKDEFISFSGKSSKIKDLKGYSKIYIMNPDNVSMKYSGGDEWMGEYSSLEMYLVKIMDDKIYMHSLAQEEGQYFFNYTKTLNDESAEIYEKK